VLAPLCLAAPASAASLVVGLLNLDDRGAEPAFVAESVVARAPAVDVWILTEFTGGAAAFETAASEAAGGLPFASAAATRGGTQKSLIVWSARRFEEAERFHLDSMELNQAVPFGVRLRALDGGPGLVVLAENALENAAQALKPLARALNDWVKGRSEPVVVAGDFGFSMPPDPAKAPEPFAFLVEGDTLRWIAPDPLEPTACAGRRIDDLLLLGGHAPGWQASARVLFRDDPRACEPAERASDHRALIATFEW
jgi:hypothetical protein